MKEYVLQLLEELVGAHNHGQKRAKADEIAALVKTAVFVADEVAPGSALTHDMDALLRMAEESPLIPAEEHHE